MARTSNFLRRVLLVDGTSCIASGLLAVFGSRALGQLLGLPDNLLLYAGLSLFPFAAFLDLRGDIESSYANECG